MIATLRGKLLEATPLQVVIEVNGIGYLVHIPVTTAERLPGLGQETRLFIHPVYREDNQQLFGFHGRDERDFFALLVEKVSGVGPRLALALMSQLSLPVLQRALSDGDVALLSKCPGIGKKTAERLIVELRDKIGLPRRESISVGKPATSTEADTGPEDPVRDAVAALISLGFKPPEADKAVRRAKGDNETITTQELIRKALGGEKTGKQ